MNKNYVTLLGVMRDNFIDLYKIPSNAHFKFEEAVFRQVI